MSSRLPFAALAGVVVLWGSGPVVTKLITTSAVFGASARFAISIPVLFAIVALRSGAVTRGTFRSTMFPGLAFGVNLMFVFAALAEITVAVLAVSIALQPAILLIVGGRFLNERVTARHAGWTLVGIAGTAGVVLGAGSELRASALGIGLALCALTTFTIYFALTRLARSRDEVDPFEWMAGINVWAFIATVIPALLDNPVEQFQLADATDWFWLCVLAWCTGVAGHVLMSWVHGFIEATRSSLYLLGMNVVAVGLAWPVHDEPITAIQVVSGLVVLFAVAAVLRLPRPGVAVDSEDEVVRSGR